MRKLILALVSFVLILTLTGTAPSWGCDILVPRDYLTIQEAINKAVDGDTICISNGTYGVSPLYYSVAGVDKPLTLLAVGDNVVFDCDGSGWGVGFRTEGVTGVTIIGIEICNCESGIVFEKSVADVDIKDCDIHDNSNYGIFNHQATVNNLTIDNVKIRDSEYWEGFFVGTNATLTNLQMSNVELNNNGGFGFCSKGTIETALLGNIEVQHNNQYYVTFGYGLALCGTANNFLIRNGIFSDNIAGGVALGYWGNSLSTTGITIENCEFQPEDTVLIDGTTTGVGNILITYNNFLNPPYSGVDNSTSTLVDARCNWWDAADGPSGSGPGSGVAVSSSVDFEPWLLDLAPDGLCYGYTEIGECAQDPRNHGQFVSCVARASMDLVETGVITKEERKEILGWAAHADIP